MWTLSLILVFALASQLDGACEKSKYPVILHLIECPDFNYNIFAPLENSRIEFVLVGKPSELVEKPLRWASFVNQWSMPDFRTTLTFETNSSHFLLDYYDFSTKESRKVRFEQLKVDNPEASFNLFIQIFQSKLSYGEAELAEDGKQFKVEEKTHRVSDYNLHNLYQEVLYEDLKQYIIGIKTAAAYELHFLPQFWSTRDAVQQNISIPHIIPHDLGDAEVDEGCIWCWTGFGLALLAGIFSGAAIIFLIFFCIYKKKAADLNERRRRAAKSAQGTPKPASELATPAKESKTGSASEINVESKSNSEKSNKGGSEKKRKSKKAKK